MHPGPILCHPHCRGCLVRDTITQHHVFFISSSAMTMRGDLEKEGIEGNPIRILKVA